MRKYEINKNKKTKIKIRKIFKSIWKKIIYFNQK